MASAAAGVLVVRVPGAVSVVHMKMIPVRVLVGVLAAGALSGCSPGLSVLLRSAVGAVVFCSVGARHLGSPRAVARHGSKCQGPGVE